MKVKAQLALAQSWLRDAKAALDDGACSDALSYFEVVVHQVAAATAHAEASHKPRAYQAQLREFGIELEALKESFVRSCMRAR